MNHGEKFRQIWDFRRRDDDDDDGDSSDDSRSNPSGVVSADNKKPQLDLVLLENDEVTDTPPKCQKLDTGIGGIDTVEPATKKIKPSKKNNNKKNVVRNESKSCSVKEKKRKTKIFYSKESGMFEDLKIFANSLIDDLKVARENMFASMKEEARKFVTSRPTRKKKVVHSNKKNKMPFLQNGLQSNVKPQKRSRISKAVEHDHVLELPMTNKQPLECGRVEILPKSCVNISKDSDQVVSSSQYLTLPTVLPEPQVHQSQGNGDKTAGSHVKLIDPRKYYHGVPPIFQQELFRSFSHVSSNGAGFLDRNCSQIKSGDFGYYTPISIHQGLENGPSLRDGSSALSSQGYSENAFQNGLRMNPRFHVGNAAASSEGISLNYVSNNGMLQQKDGDLVPLRSQGMKDSQFLI